MGELCLAQYPLEESPIAFKIATIQGEPTPFVNPMYAVFIHTMLQRAGAVDHDAVILRDLYRDGTVMKDSVPHLEDTLKAVTPAETLANLVYRAEKEGRIAHRVADIMHRIQLSSDLSHTVLLTREGLYSEKVFPDHEVPPYLDDVYPYDFKDDPHAKTLAKDMDLDVFSYAKELVWRSDGTGELRPLLLSDLDHIALGRMDDDGNFEHVVTVLSPDHPVRSMAIGLDY